MSKTSSTINENYKLTDLHRAKMTLLSIVVAIIITIFHIQLANFIFQGEFNFWQSGSPSYSKAAYAIVQQNMLSIDQINPSAYRPPLYPIFLAALLLISEQTQPIIIAQSALAGITFGLLTAVGYMYTRKTWPVLLMIFLFPFINFIPVGNIIQHETVLFTTLLCLGAIIFISETEKHSANKVIGLGFTLGLAALTRPLAPAVLIVIFLWFVWLLVQKTHLTEVLKKVLLVSSVFILTLLPWGLRNWMSLGTFTLTSTTAGLNLWKGNNPATNDIYPELDIDTFGLLLNEVPVESGWWNDLHLLPQLSEASQDKYLFDLGKQYILEHPIHFLNMAGVKFVSFWTPKNIPIFVGKAIWTPTGAEIYDLRPFYDNILPTLLLYLLALPGIWQNRRSPFVLYLIAWSIALSALHSITFAESRFRWPINMLMLPMAAVGLHLIVSKIIAAFKRSKILRS